MLKVVSRWVFKYLLLLTKFSLSRCCSSLTLQSFRHRFLLLLFCHMRKKNPQCGTAINKRFNENEIFTLHLIQSDDDDVGESFALIITVIILLYLQHVHVSICISTYRVVIAVNNILACDSHLTRQATVRVRRKWRVCLWVIIHCEKKSFAN